MSDEVLLHIDSFRGYSAYEIYCQHHPEWTGTEEEWLASLAGAVSSVNGKSGAVVLKAQDIQLNDGTNLQNRVLDSTFRLRTSEWDGDGPYTQTKTVTGIKSSDTPIVDIDLSTDATSDNVDQKLRSWSYVSYIQTGQNSVTAVCLKNKPDIAFDVKVKVIR